MYFPSHPHSITVPEEPNLRSVGQENDQVVPQMNSSNPVSSGGIQTSNINSNSNQTSSVSSQQQNRLIPLLGTSEPTRGIPVHVVDVDAEMRNKRRKLAQSSSQSNSSGAGSSSSLNSSQSSTGSAVANSNGAGSSGNNSGSGRRRRWFYRVKRVKTGDGRYRAILVRVPAPNLSIVRSPPNDDNYNSSDDDCSSSDDSRASSPVLPSLMPIPVENVNQSKCPFPIDSIEKLGNFNNRIGTQRAYHWTVYRLFGRVCQNTPDVPTALKKVLCELVTQEVKKQIAWEVTPGRFHFRKCYIHWVLFQGVRQVFPTVTLSDMENTIKEWIDFEPQE